MATNTATRAGYPAQHTKKHVHHSRGGCGCGCGDAPEEPVCCGVDRLVQPRFFCGQMLTDADLSALLTWTQQKARLARYRDGWGVACGLDVRRHPSKPSVVTVGPGYAVSCCGDDIVVCEEAERDLGAACPREGDPCAMPGPVVRRNVTESAADGGDTTSKSDPCFDLDCAVDLYIRYTEVQTDPQTALRRGSCDQLARCEYSRVAESAELYYLPASDPEAERGNRWCQQYLACHEVLNRYYKESQSFPTNGDNDDGASRYATAVRSWLLRWIELNPLHQFHFLRDAICRLDDAAVTDDQTVLRLLLWLIQDCRNAFLRGDCPVCEPAAGVRLARIFLEPDSQAGPTRRRVSYIDPYPPHRRLLGRDTGHPAAAGAWNLGRLIWSRPEEACTTLSELGIRVRTRPLTLPNSLVEGGEIWQALQCCPIVTCGQGGVTVYTVEFCDGSERVIAICQDRVPESVTDPPSSDFVTRPIGGLDRPDAAAVDRAAVGNPVSSGEELSDASSFGESAGVTARMSTQAARRRGKQTPSES